ncbi:helix-turn-helix domain-containing protein [Flavobacterium sp. WC2409]|uniref:Helix-turn-helix domain-containing protein n=1 Tax=Flavobacterium sp. WC2409 TaxID=3234139 RepID=A0AB39W3V5_9FLAO
MFVSTKEAMVILGVKSETTIREYEKKGYITPYRSFSNRKRYKVKELEKALNKR